MFCPDNNKRNIESTALCSRGFKVHYLRDTLDSTLLHSRDPIVQNSNSVSKILYYWMTGEYFIVKVKWIPVHQVK